MCNIGFTANTLFDNHKIKSSTHHVEVDLVRRQKSVNNTHVTRGPGVTYMRDHLMGNAAVVLQKVEVLRAGDLGKLLCNGLGEEEAIVSSKLDDG